jgi:hypothetical protein
MTFWKTINGIARPVRAFLAVALSLFTLGLPVFGQTQTPTPSNNPTRFSALILNWCKPM